MTAACRLAVALTLRAADEPGPGAVAFFHRDRRARPRTIARFAGDPDTASALAHLLDGPVWLLIVAADVPGCVFGRLWALVPVEVDAPALLEDEDPVFALPLTELRVSDDERVHPGDLIAEVSHLLHHLAPGRSGTA